MEITPQDVQQMRFDPAKRGFDPQQVGAFLDRAAGALAARDRELHEARTEIEALGRAVADVKQNEEAFRLTMNAATEAKEEMLRRAREEAARIEQQAREAAAMIEERARVDAEDQLAGLKRELESLKAERARLEAQLADTRHSPSDEVLGAAQEGVGRPPLELVVDQELPAAATGDSELAARVGDLRG